MVSMNKLAVPRPQKNQIIKVYYENNGSVPMKVVEIKGNLLECEFEGVEVCVRLGKVFDGENWMPRWQSITN